MWEGSRVLDALRVESMLRALMMMIERQRATRARACVCGRVEGCSSARSLVGVTIMYLRSSVHFIRRWPFSPASCTSYRCLTLPSRFWRPAPQPLVTFCARSPRLHFLVAAAVALVAPAHQSPVTCAPAPLACHLLVVAAVAFIRPRASVAGYPLRPLPSIVHASSFILVAQKEKKTGVLQCKIRKSRFALSNKQLTTLIHESQDQCAAN